MFCWPCEHNIPLNMTVLLLYVPFAKEMYHVTLLAQSPTKLFNSVGRIANVANNLTFGWIRFIDYHSN